MWTSITKPYFHYLLIGHQRKLLVDTEKHKKPNYQNINVTMKCITFLGTQSTKRAYCKLV